MVINLLNKLHDNGELRQLVNSGIMSVNIDYWRKIYNTYNSRLTVNENKPFISVNETCDVFDISPSTVYRVIKKMEYQPKPIKQ